MAGKLSFEEGASIYKPPLFCGLNYKFWEARMKIFIESIDKRIWDSIENGPYIPKLKKDNSFIAKPLSKWPKDECKMAQLDRSAQNIIASALDTNEFFRISKCKIAKEMWETLKAAHEPKEATTKSQARRKRRKNKKSLNLCFMARREDDSRSVNWISSCKYDTLVCENCENLEKKVHYLVKIVDKLSKGQSNFESVLAS